MFTLTILVYYYSFAIKKSPLIYDISDSRQIKGGANVEKKGDEKQVSLQNKNIIKSKSYFKTNTKNAIQTANISPQKPFKQTKLHTTK